MATGTTRSVLAVIRTAESAGDSSDSFTYYDTATYLERIVSQERRRRAEVEPAGPVCVTTPAFADIHIRNADLAEYDRVLGARIEKEIPTHADASSDTPERSEEPDRPRP